jgi:plastocyanin
MIMSRVGHLLRRRRGIYASTLSVVALVAFPASALAGDARKVFAMDRCEPDSFNAAVGPGTCVRNGGVSFDNFVRRLNPQDGGHNAWRFSRHDVDLTPGQRITVTNTGGEEHTFTEVVDFGAGVVPPLNAALPPGTPPAQPVSDDLGLLAAGESLRVDALSAGTHRFECIIHPWMRTVVQQAG